MRKKTPNSNDPLTRRHFLQIAGATGLSTVLCLEGGCHSQLKKTRHRHAQAGDQKKVVVIGFDGFDPRLAERLMEHGELPHLARLRTAGGYARLGTSTPPQSPVAWANFITGADPGAHGIFDFIHRDPSGQCRPYYSAAETVPGVGGWDVGEHKVPLTFWPFNHSPTQTLLRREGTPFWEYLDAAGIPSLFFDIPSNYPPSPSAHGNHCCLSGMGTPDLMGNYGTYQCFSSRARKTLVEGGGLTKPLVFKNDAATGTLTGPLNTLLKQPRDAELEFRVYRHPQDAVARIEIEGRTIVLKAGEWSDWQRITFALEMPDFLPDQKVRGICRFYLQQVHPVFRLYVSPLNIDPADPSQPISEPTAFVKDIADRLGQFGTLGFQEDHKALTNRVFTDEEFRTQADFVLQERMNLLNYALEQYEDGLLFFYFSSTDLQSHMFWWDTDDKHPTRDAAQARQYMGVVEDLYRRLDGVIGSLLERFGDKTTLLVMSDHGFCNFRRQFNLNSWLRDNGYLGPDTCAGLLTTGPRAVDWSRTRAYALGINGLYLNLQGRERDGIVPPGQREALLEELRAKLLLVHDPLDGQPVIAAVDRTDQVYHGPHAERAPDLIVGYHRGFRCSWVSALGDLTADIFSDNDQAWSADHCMAASELPGVLFCNQPLKLADPTLIDLAPTILTAFGLTPPATMTGRNVL